MNTGILDTLWNWIHDKNHVVNGICFELEGKIVGIAHFRKMPRTPKGFTWYLQNQIYPYGS